MCSCSCKCFKLYDSTPCKCIAALQTTMTAHMIMATHLSWPAVFLLLQLFLWVLRYAFVVYTKCNPVFPCKNIEWVAFLDVRMWICFSSCVLWSYTESLQFQDMFNTPVLNNQVGSRILEECFGGMFSRKGRILCYPTTALTYCYGQQMWWWSE